MDGQITGRGTQISRTVKGRHALIIINYGDDNDDKQNYFVSLLITKEIF